MSSDQVLNAFLQQYLDDLATMRRRTLAEYQALFPGADDAIASHYGRYQGETRPGDGGHPLVDRIGRFRIVREVGRGGQGVVYLAEDDHLHRRVAVKVLTGIG